MKTVLQNEKYGEIVVEESIWTGRKNVFVAGKQLAKVDKTRYLLEDNNYIELVGNSVKGLSLLVDGQSIPVIPPAKWYEIALSVFIMVFFIAWGNSVALRNIVPMVGGAIGGMFSGLFGCINFFTMRSVKNVALKLAVFVAFFAVTFGVLAGLAFLILQA